MTFTLRLPGSTSNLGPGYDVLGLALGIYNTLTFELSTDESTTVEVSGEGESELPHDASNLVIRSAERAAAEIGRALPHLRVTAQNNIPLARGLGSSSTAIAGGVMAANRLLGDALSRDDLVQLASQIEGHPDNVTPCIIGGLTISSMENSGCVIFISASPCDGLEAVVVVPTFELRTEDARNVLPASVPHGDAVYNVGRACLVTAALLTGSFGVLAEAMDDRLHQPYRAALVPGFADVIAAAKDAGALNASLSGGGPTLFALTTQSGERVAEAMVEAWKQHGVTAHPHVLAVDTGGATFE